MNREVREYLVPPQEAWFWRWVEHGEVAEWTKSSQTIAFRAELYEILEHLSPHGLPPLDSILLIMAACREELEWDRRFSINSLLKAGISVQASISLEAIHGLPRFLRASQRCKKVVVEKVLEHTRSRTAPKLTQQILHTLKTGLDQATLQPLEAANENLIDLAHSRLTSVEQGLKGLDAESLRLRVETGLEKIVEETPVELPQCIGAGRLLAELAEDDELSGFARLARQVIAAIRLPKATSEDKDLPLGGIADITNRGELDQLLLSELAHDDLVLTTRLATQEALFVRRESPREQSIRARHILVDSGIRMWGTPRMLSASVALGLLAGEGNEHSRVFRAMDDVAMPIDLACRDGLMQHLSVLETSPTPASALTDFRRLCTEPTETDFILLTSPNTLADSNFRIALNQCRFPKLYVITIVDTGELQVQLFANATSRELLKLRLDPELLEPKSRSRTPRATTKRYDELPAIFNLRRLPFRMPAPRCDLTGPQRNSWLIDTTGKTVVLTNDRRALYYDRPGLGAVELSTSIPKGKVYWAATKLDNGISRALVRHGNAQKWYLVNVNVDEMKVRVEECHDIPTFSQHAFAVQVAEHHVLILQNNHYRTQCVLLNAQKNICDGAWRYLDLSLDHTRIPFADPWGNHSSYLPPKNNDMHWYALTYKNRRVHVDSYDTSAFIEHPNSNSIRGIFTAPGSPTPIAITEDHRLHLAFEREAFRTPSRPFFIESKPLTGKTGYETRLVPRFVGTENVRKKFKACTITAEGSLALLSKSRHKAELMCNRIDEGLGSLGICYRERYAAPNEIANAQPFENTIKKIPGHSSQLRYAEWPDGSRAYLDSRGLLHIKSSNPEIPELTIVLASPNDRSPAHKVITKAWTANSGVLPGDKKRGANLFSQILNDFIEQVGK